MKIDLILKVPTKAIKVKLGGHSYTEGGNIDICRSISPVASPVLTKQVCDGSTSRIDPSPMENVVSRIIYSPLRDILGKPKNK